MKGIVCFEADIPASLLTDVTVLGCADWRRGDGFRSCGVFLPTTVWAESEGTSINFEGRAQRFQRAMGPGLPLRGLEAKYYARPCGGPAAVDADEAPLHPPRVHRGESPEGSERDAWRVIAQLSERLGGEPVTEPLSGTWEVLRNLDPEAGGVRLLDLE